MRSDTSLDESFVNSKDWDADPVSGKSAGDVDRYKLPHATKARMSLSGSERNHMFIKRDDNRFVDVSGNSGLDSAADGRCIAVFDFDRDGLQDFLLTNCNQQTLNIYRNQVGKLTSQNNFVAVRFVGGNSTDTPSTEFSARDAVGASVTVAAGNVNVIRELRCGEGLAAQNSRTLIIGLGDSSLAESVEVVWPTGKISRVAGVPSQSLVTFHENVAESKDGSGFTIEPYQPVIEKQTVATHGRLRFPLDTRSGAAPVMVYTAMATWCEACKHHLPDLIQIQEAFGGSIPVYAIPIDFKDDARKLEQYKGKFRPAYNLLEPDERRGRHFTEFVQSQLGTANLPFSAIVSGNGTVIQVMTGLPTLSELKQALARVRNEPGWATE